MSRRDEASPRRPRRATTFPVRFAAVDDVVPPASYPSSRYTRSTVSSEPAEAYEEDASERGRVVGIENLYDQLRAERKRRHRETPYQDSWSFRQRSRGSRSRGSDSDSPDRRRRDSDDGYDTTSDTSRESIRSPHIRYPSPPRSRPLERYISTTLSTDESESEDDAYDFTLSRRTPSRLSQESASTDSDSAKLIEERTKASGTIYGNPQGVCVIKSQYAGEGTIGGLQRADLAVIQDSRPDRTALWRWIHIKDRDMVFDDFHETIFSIPGLDDIERHSLGKLLARVKRKFDKPMQTAKNNRSRIMKSGFLQEELSRPSGPKDKHSKPRMATWICAPYFMHDEHAGNKTSSKLGTHPVRTLLQYRFPSARKERDMLQAVCNLPQNPSGFCFHVAQVWYLILDQSLLVTCAGIPLSMLQGDMISISPVPKPEGPRSEPQKLLVAYGGSVLWSFPLDECQSWFALLAKFSEFWPQKFRLTHQGKTITQALWSRIFSLAKRSPFNVNIRLELSGPEKITTRGVLNSTKEPKESGGRASIDKGTDGSGHLWGAGGDPSEAMNDDNPGDKTKGPEPMKNETIGSTNGYGADGKFSVLTWANASPKHSGGASFDVDQVQMLQDLEQIDEFLSRHTSLEESLAYRLCPENTYQGVLSSLREQVEEFAEPISAGQSKDEQKSRADLGCRVDFFNACESVFQFFLPLSVDGPTVKKYWGAVGSLVEPWSNKSRSQSQTRSNKKPKFVRIGQGELREVCEAFEDIMLKTKAFGELLSQASPEARAKIIIPDELVKAWLHIVMSLLNSTLFDSQIGTAFKLLDSGMKQIMQGLARDSLLDKIVLQPLDIASLTGFRILQDITSIGRDVGEVYAEYVRSLESNIYSNPLDRGHQVKLALLNQELSIVMDILAEQRSLVEEISSSNKMSHAREEKQIDRSYAGVKEYSRVKSTKTLREDYAVDYDRRHSRSRAADRMYYDDHEPTHRTGAFNSRPARRDDVTTVGAQNSNQSKLASTDPRGYRELLVQDCIDMLDTKDRDFKEMQMKAYELETFNIQRIDSNKDRQEAAIYVFTVVTIIFLPLSTVAGILGMNTYDVRNMKYKQWVFWATAVPLALIIIVLCLAWIGDLKNIWRGFTNLWRGRVGAVQPSTMPVEDPYREVVVRRHPRSPLYR